MSVCSICFQPQSFPLNKSVIKIKLVEMSDHNEKEGPESSASTGSSDEGQSTDLKKTCVDCGTSKTPLWRGGPAGPKSLCNACGIKSRKKRRPSDEVKKKKKKKKKSGGLKLNLHHHKDKSDPWKSKLFVTKRRSSSKMGEVEQAAALLMALSSVYG